MKNKLSGELSVWESSVFLKTEEDINNYWEACQEEGDNDLLRLANKRIAEARNHFASVISTHDGSKLS
jgi:DNA-binding phage protein